MKIEWTGVNIQSQTFVSRNSDNEVILRWVRIGETENNTLMCYQYLMKVGEEDTSTSYRNAEFDSLDEGIAWCENYIKSSVKTLSP